jgi:hypothetical protein
MKNSAVKTSNLAFHERSRHVCVCVGGGALVSHTHSVPISNLVGSGYTDGISVVFLLAITEAMMVLPFITLFPYENDWNSDCSGGNFIVSIRTATCT